MIADNTGGEAMKGQRKGRFYYGLTFCLSSTDLKNIGALNVITGRMQYIFEDLGK